jgi:hypothetical protein
VMLTLLLHLILSPTSRRVTLSRGGKSVGGRIGGHA